MARSAALHNQLEQALRAGRELLTETRSLILASVQDTLGYRRKADGTWVTDIDLAVEELVRSRLETWFPEYGVVGEEFADRNSIREFTWVVDPIDGTRALRHGIPLFGTILALLHEGAPAVGLIDLPLLGRLYSGGTGLGVELNGRSLRIEDQSPFPLTRDSTINVGARGQHVAAGIPEFFDELAKDHPGLRTYGDCFGHGMVLDGSADAMTDLGGLHLWDIAATQALVPEAGGKFVIWRQRGTAPADAYYDVIFGKPQVVDWLISRLPQANA